MLPGTVGHPLADLTNLVEPWTICKAAEIFQSILLMGAANTTPDWPRIHADRAFLDPSRTESTNKDFPGLPSRAQAVQWYSETSGFDVPDTELTWASSFALFRDSIIFQGIAARYAVRQASNEKAKLYGQERIPFANMAWDMVEAAKAKQGSKSRL